MDYTADPGKQTPVKQQENTVVANLLNFPAQSRALWSQIIGIRPRVIAGFPEEDARGL
jgi:hypothetical protein